MLVYASEQRMTGAGSKTDTQRDTRAAEPTLCSAIRAIDERVRPRRCGPELLLLPVLPVR